MYCVNCSDYDAEYRGGWCDRLREPKNPYNTCDLEDDRARSYENHTCSECSDVDKPIYYNYMGLLILSIFYSTTIKNII